MTNIKWMLSGEANGYRWRSETTDAEGRTTTAHSERSFDSYLESLKDATEHGYKPSPENIVTFTRG